ncbi:hypothetical protein FRC08_001704 [Ceratobasidium sp. 394]|nr:hypothetical protein FRC08_001704 [Ceratobasidium sp. 394]
MAEGQVEQLSRYRGRQPLSVLPANPDHESDSPVQVPETPHLELANAETLSDPSQTSPAPGNSSRLELGSPSLMLDSELDPVVTPMPNHATSVSPVVGSQQKLGAALIRSRHIRRTYDGAVATEPSSAHKPFSPPPRHAISAPYTPSERTIVSITHDAQNYTDVDITDHMGEAQVIRKRLLSSLAIPEDLHSSFAIYRTTLSKFTTGNPLDDDRLLIDCHGFGDSKGSLKFFAQHIGASPRPRPLPPPPSLVQSMQTLQVTVGDSPTANSNNASGENEVPSTLPPANSSSRNNQSPLDHSADGPAETIPPDPLPRATVVIGRTMPAANIIQHLVQHGCRDMTADLDSSSCSEYPIANGGFGDVYRGQLGKGKRVAIKCMRVFECPDAEEQQQKYLKRAAREIHTWSKLRHPHVLRLLGLVVYHDRIGMVSPWVERGTVRYYLTRTPEADRPQICTQIAGALLYLHQSGVIHGDLKGDNVLVSDAGEPLITDFGNAILQERTLQFTSSTTGTHLSTRWAAPELLKGSVRSFEADIFALGMTILEVITGNLPYAGMGDVAVVLAIVSNQLPERPETHIPRSSRHGDRLWSLFEGCCASEPAMRPVASTVKVKLSRIKPEDLVAQ